eukprot:TRINITY_DN25198_c0_g1_i1.p2 TRINITY_DN25198_c0_g1~~TRINITY_DN25198_c0_g1_i1.p2  ORF type:complete len:100 (+),score=3.39 TRINITY_DN25198_c0_g1_i1:1475-1774(+)
MVHGGFGGGQTNRSDTTVPPATPTSLTVTSAVSGKMLGGVLPRSATIHSLIVPSAASLPKSGDTKHLVQPTLSEQRAQKSNSVETTGKLRSAGARSASN